MRIVTAVLHPLTDFSSRLPFVRSNERRKILPHVELFFTICAIKNIFFEKGIAK